MSVVSTLNSVMHFEELPGEETAVVFLHGNPSSSHAWRHVMPALDVPFRRLAPDLIGMGQSGKPAIEYRFGDHAAYLDAWFDALELDRVILVGYDWGGALAFDWASRHPQRVLGVAFFETIVRGMSWSDLGEAPRGRAEAMRGPEGERLALESNFFIETAYTGGVRTPVEPDDLAAYLQPYPDAASRRPILQWARSLPLDGEPAEVADRVAHYDAWLADSAGIPKLLLTFDSSPTLLIDEATAAWCDANIANLERVHCGPAGHHATEDQPDAIVAALMDWIGRHFVS